MSTSFLTRVVLHRSRLLILGFVSVACLGAAPAQEAAKVSVHWDKTTVVSKSTPTLQVVVNPPLRPGRPLGIAAYKAVKELGADYVRYVPWLPYPRLAVAELEPPTPRKTSWNFSLIDPMTKDFLAATDGHPTVMNFSTIPAWLFKTDKPVTYPDDPNKPVWNYTQGTEERDPTDREIGDYYARLVSWYVDGGFNPSVSMMDWTKNQPNARYWALKLIKDSFHAGDKLVETSIRSRDVAAQGIVTEGRRKLLLANERNRSIDVELRDAEKASVLTVDAETGDGPALRRMLLRKGSRHSKEFVSLYSVRRMQFEY